MSEQFQNLLRLLEGLFWWLAPFTIFILALVLPSYVFSFDYLRLIEIVIWPFTVLIALFFFKKVFTYLFFTIDEFNFFGAKGHLKNVNDLMEEEVTKRVKQLQEDKDRETERNKLKKEIEKAQIKDGNNIKILETALSLIKKSETRARELEEENAKLSRALGHLQSVVSGSEQSSTLVGDSDGKETSGPPLEEDNREKI